GLDADQSDDKRVARLGAVDEERADLRIRRVGNLVVGGVAALGVDGLRHDAVAGLDVQRWRMRAGVGDVVVRRGEPVRLGREDGAGARSDQDRGDPELLYHLAATLDHAIVYVNGVTTARAVKIVTRW